MAAAELKWPPILSGPADNNRRVVFFDHDYALKQQRIKKEGGRKNKQSVEGGWGGGQITGAQAVRLLIKTTGDKNKTTSYIPIACIRW